MAGRPRRTFTLRDAMVLVAATAVGFAWARLSCVNGFIDIKLGHWSYSAGLLLKPLLATWTVTIAALRLLSPRPPLRRLVLQPGASACFAVAFVLAMESLRHAGLEISQRGGITHPIFDTSYIGWELYVFVLDQGFLHHIVATVWGLLWLGRRWRPEPSWIDRTGRVLGAAWIVLALLSWAESLVALWNDHPTFR